MEVVDVLINSTSTKNQASFLHRTYTLYHIKVYTKNNTYIIEKRFRQFHSLWQKIKIASPLCPVLSNFPKKSCFPMSRNVVSFRKKALEGWLKDLISYNIEPRLVCEFLKVKKFIENEEFTPDEQLVLTFIEKITTESNKKIAFLDKFEKEFFLRRRAMNPEITASLLTLLVPMCADPSCMSKPMDIISKLLNRDFYRYFDCVQKVFVSLPIKILKRMNFKDYIKQKINPDSQRRAYEIIELIRVNSEDGQVAVEEILENDQDSLRIYNNWGSCEEKKISSAYSSDVIPLIKRKDLHLEYKISEKVITVGGFIEATSSISKICDLFIDSDMRRTWDLALEDMRETEAGYKMTYVAEKNIYNFECDTDIEEDSNWTRIIFKGTLIDCPNSKFSSTFLIEKIQGNDSDEFEEVGKLRCSWNLEYRGKASKIIMLDIVGEDNKLQNSFILLLEAAQARNFSICGRIKNNSIHEAVQRKNKKWYK
ncbi:hypothetical protein SteCoe_7410 [Stentor coeruleus]|uniref:PX domain-containing protein n=1 Tax=Stentor coeruleus TaxID=5963 RepID=A0A1R2CMS7_9CILI|nr:hypothetical protein SteCoe_7410 [Stentor coeruleus]